MTFSANHVEKMNFHLKSEVARISVKNSLTHTATNDILCLLRDLGHDVPKDDRTLLDTTREKSDSNLEHFGLILGIVKKIRQGVGVGVIELNLVINIDGAPLYRFSNTNFWPVLGRITNIKDSRPFVMGIYYGPSKLPCLEDFLCPFIEEMKKLEKHKVTVDGRSFSVNLQCVVCDAPVRSFVKKCVGHGAFFGCERCVQRGEKIGGSMTFQATDSDLRNDMSFRHQRNKQHHQGTSPFTELNIDMIKGNYYVYCK
jgi:hypothetical protein